MPVDVIDIADPDDPRVDDFRDLNSVDRRPDLPVLPGGRPGRGLVVAEGVLVVQRMIASRFAPHAFLGVEKRRVELADDLTDPSVDGVPFYRATAEVMAEVVGFHLNRGVLGVARRPERLTLDAVVADARTVAVLEGVNDHENIGSIFRNAAGLGVDAVIFGRGCADPLYRRAVRVSMGHALLVPFAMADDWPGDLHALRDSGFTVVSLTPDPDAVALADAVDAERVAFMVGAEGPGLSETAMRAGDVRARIPMARGTDSLNVATAAAIAFYARAAR
ncbi:MAG: RNA methyltransferase [Gordonia paraffinivorans]